MKNLNELAQDRIAATNKRLETNAAYVDALVTLEVAKSASNTLKGLIAQCEEVVRTYPLINPATRKERKFAGSRMFQYGTGVDLMFQLITGIQYSQTEHKQLMLAATGLSEPLIDSSVAAFGRPAYYSVKDGGVVAEEPGNAEMAVTLLSVVGAQLGILIDTSGLTDTKMKTYFHRESVKARLTEREAEQSLEMPFTLD